MHDDDRGGFRAAFCLRLGLSVLSIDIVPVWSTVTQPACFWPPAQNVPAFIPRLTASGAGAFLIKGTSVAPPKFRLAQCGAVVLMNNNGATKFHFLRAYRIQERVTFAPRRSPDAGFFAFWPLFVPEGRAIR